MKACLQKTLPFFIDALTLFYVDNEVFIFSLE